MREYKVNGSIGAEEGGLGHEVLKKNRNFYIGVAGTVLEGMLSGSLFMLLYAVMQFLWAGRFDMNQALVLTGVIAGIFLLRILIYSYGYTKAQIGGAEVSRNIRLFMGDHLKRIPLSRFTQGQTGDYINTITSDVNNYEKILTHKIGDLAKSFALSIMLIVFVMTVYVPAGLILLAADLLLIPGLWLSFRMVRKYGQEKNDICAENVSSIVEYVSGIQTFRAYGVGGLKNKTVIDAMRAFCRISYVYEAKVLPVGAGLSILTWLACPLVIWAAYAPWAAGTLDTVSYLLICMLPLFCAKLANTIFVDLTSYKNLMISKSKILGVMEEPEESGSMEPFQTDTHEITFDHVDFAYVPGEPVLKQATFTVPDQKLTAIVGDSGSGKSTILNLIAKYYEPSGGAISIGGRPTGRVAAERVLEQISMVDQDVFLFDDTIRDNIRQNLGQSVFHFIHLAQASGLYIRAQALNGLGSRIHTDIGEDQRLFEFLEQILVHLTEGTQYVFYKPAELVARLGESLFDLIKKTHKAPLIFYKIALRLIDIQRQKPGNALLRHRHAVKHVRFFHCTTPV